MDDPFLERLKSDWRTNAIDLAPLQRRVARRQAWLQAAPWGHVAGALLLTACLAWFAVNAIKQWDVVLGLGAFAYLVALIAVLVGFMKSLDDRRMERHEGPMAFLRMHRRLIETLRRSLWGARCAAIIMIGLCLTILLMAAAGLAQAKMALLLSAAWGMTAGLTWTWQVWRRRRLDEEADGCDRMIAAFEAADRGE